MQGIGVKIYAVK